MGTELVRAKLASAYGTDKGCPFARFELKDVTVRIHAVPHGYDIERQMSDFHTITCCVAICAFRPLGQGVVAQQGYLPSAMEFGPGIDIRSASPRPWAGPFNRQTTACIITVEACRLEELLIVAELARLIVIQASAPPGWCQGFSFTDLRVHHVIGVITGCHGDRGGGRPSA